jgi:predicted protein tyrosine phosphatase
VSLLDPGSSFPDLSKQHLRIEMHDIDELQDGFDAPADSHLNSIIEFVTPWGRDEPILVHCWAGISRSTATAFITACLHNPDVEEIHIAQKLREVSHTATPNRRLIALADQALKRDGRMIAAIESIGRGPPWYEIGEATPFVLPSRY